MKAVIMAAGKGTRMLPITQTIPKVLIEVAGKPFLYHVMKRLHDAGITDIGLVVSYKKEMVEEFLEEYNFQATIIDQGKPMGTGHAALVAREFVGGENFLLLGGDNLWSVNDIKAMIHEDEEWYVAAWTVENPERYGVLVCEENKLKKIVEKPKEHLGNLINSGLYKFTSEVFDIQEEQPLSERGEYEITDALTTMAEKGRVQVYTLQDYWLDLGKLEDIPNVEEFMRKLDAGEIRINS